ncbi:MAG: hypothetical protein ACJZ9F_03935 [Rhodospirillaceae bacterium]
MNETVPEAQSRKYYWILRTTLAVIIAIIFSEVPVLAQEDEEALPNSGSVQPEESEGRRLGNLPNDQIRQFKMRKACELDQPDCLPHIREMLEAERRNRNWMALSITGVLFVLVLVSLRESQRKKKRLAEEMASHKRLGERLKRKWD